MNGWRWVVNPLVDEPLWSVISLLHPVPPRWWLLALRHDTEAHGYTTVADQSPLLVLRGTGISGRAVAPPIFVRLPTKVGPVSLVVGATTPNCHLLLQPVVNDGNRGGPIAGHEPTLLRRPGSVKPDPWPIAHPSGLAVVRSATSAGRLLTPLPPVGKKFALDRSRRWLGGSPKPPDRQPSPATQRSWPKNRLRFPNDQTTTR